MENNYDLEIKKASEHVFEVMSKRCGAEEMGLLFKAFEFAKDAHKVQRRKSGEPYIIHPIAVATIAAEELKLDANSVIAAFLHDVVEDTDYSADDIRNMFGNEVAFLVDVVTKKKKDHYKMSKQVDNYQQLLDSFHYDIRALMVKIADRLHNMRTLSSMAPDKRMKIAGETDYFYAPLANRLGLYDVKTDLENLSFKYRCPGEFEDIDKALRKEIKRNAERLEVFTTHVREILRRGGINTAVEVYYRRPYSIWRKMKTGNKDFKHVDNHYYVRITFDKCVEGWSEKNTCLKIYSLLTDVFKEKPQSFNNQIDMAKENSYQSLNVMLLSEEGVWEDVQICSSHMVESSKLGCMAELGRSNVSDWMARFRVVLEDIAKHSQETSFIESVVTSLYYDDVMVFTPTGRAVVLPKGATVIDFAFELHTELGMHAKYARVNGKLCSVKTELHRGDVVEVGTSDIVTAKDEWFDFASTYKAKRAIRNNIVHQKTNYVRCPHCSPLPGGEIIGFKDEERIIIHRRSCPEAIHLASRAGDSIVAVDFHAESNVTYPVTIHVRAIDRYHLLIDLIDTITNTLHLSIDSLNTITKDEIVDCTITFFVHSVSELVATTNHLYNVSGVDEVRQKHE